MIPQLPTYRNFYIFGGCLRWLGVAAILMLASLRSTPCRASEPAAPVPASMPVAQQQEVFFSPRQNILRRKVIELIDAEKQSLKIAMYHLTDESIIWAIKRAVGRNVTVDIVVDRSSIEKLTRNLKCKLGGSLPAHIRIMQCDLPNITFMHHKFVLFGKNKGDKSLLWIGSYNFTQYLGSEESHDNAVLLDCQAVIAEFGDQFARLIQRDAHVEQAAQYPVALRDSTVIREAFFSPRGGCEQALLGLIKGEEHSIKIAMDEFTNYEIIKALADRARYLAEPIELIIFKYDEEQANTGSTQLGYWSIDSLQKAGAVIYKYNKTATDLMHHKFAIFGGNSGELRGKRILARPLVWTGSYNFTTAAESNNCESAILLDEPAIVQKFVEQFDLLKEKYVSRIAPLKPPVCHVLIELGGPLAHCEPPAKRQRT